MSHVVVKMQEKNDTNWRSVLREKQNASRYTCFSDDTHTYFRGSLPLPRAALLVLGVSVVVLRGTGV